MDPDLADMIDMSLLSSRDIERKEGLFVFVEYYSNGAVYYSLNEGNGSSLLHASFNNYELIGYLMLIN